MQQNIISVRELQEQDIDLISAYWNSSDHDFLKAMGVDVKKLPGADLFKQQLSEQIAAAYDQKRSYCIIWLLNDKPIGHCNVNKILFGKEAFMHLHIWYEHSRRLGLGTGFIKQTIPYFFNNLQLKKLFCEPYALNPSPNNTLKKLGFTFIKEYITTPGALNFEQPVKLWELTPEQFI